MQTKVEAMNLRDYQQFALAGIKEADQWDQGFHSTDSFYLWSFDDFGKQFGKNRITRTKSNGFYHYIFWTRSIDTATIYQEDSIPIVQFWKDTLYDINGDKLKDLVITSDSHKAEYMSKTSKIFLLDSTLKKYVKLIP